MRDPDSFDELEDWRRNEAPPWIESAIEDYNLTWEGAWALDPDHSPGMQPLDEWDSLRIDADGPEEWSVTIGFDDGSTETLDFGGDWEAAWDLYDLAQALDYVDDERGEVDYEDD